jgi:hypothetical protein
MGPDTHDDQRRLDEFASNCWAIAVYSGERCQRKAVMRFGRDGEGATVYVETDSLPGWVPVHGRGEVVSASDGLQQTTEALTTLGPATTAEIVDTEAVSITPQAVRNHLETLRELDVAHSVKDPADGRRQLHTLTDPGAVSPDGVAVLPEDDTDEATEDTGQSSERKHYSSTIVNPFATSADPGGDSEGSEDSGQSSERKHYSSSIVNPFATSDAPDTDTDGQQSTGETGGESSGRKHYSSSIVNPSATSDDHATDSEGSEESTEAATDGGLPEACPFRPDPDPDRWGLSARVVDSPTTDDQEDTQSHRETVTLSVVSGSATATTPEVSISTGTTDPPGQE